MSKTLPKLTGLSMMVVVGAYGATEYDMDGFNQFYGHGRVNAENSVDTTLATLGDFDRDQDVDGRDFLVWQRSFGATADPVGTGADGDLSGTVGSGDLTVWQAHYGETIPAPLVAASTASSTVPELAQSLPRNFFVTIYPSVKRAPEITLSDFVMLDDSTARAAVFAALDLPTNRQSHDHYLVSNQEDSQQGEAIDEVFQSLGDQFLLEFVNI